MRYSTDLCDSSEPNYVVIFLKKLLFIPRVLDCLLLFLFCFSFANLVPFFKYIVRILLNITPFIVACLWPLYSYVISFIFTLLFFLFVVLSFSYEVIRFNSVTWYRLHFDWIEKILKRHIRDVPMYVDAFTVYII